MAELFSQQLEDLLDPRPIFADPEDSAGDATRARVTESFQENEEVDVGAVRSAVLLHETDTRYEGKKVSRRQLTDEEGHGGEEEGEYVTDDDDEEEEGEYVEDDEEEDDKEDNEDVGDDEDELMTVRDSGADLTMKNRFLDFQRMKKELDDLVVAESEDDDDGKKEDAVSIQTFSQARLEEEVAKGEAVKDQLALWDRLLEARIKIQKSLVAANQLPTSWIMPEFQRRGGKELAAALKGSHTALNDLQSSLLELHSLLLQHLPTTHLIFPGTTPSVSPEDPGGYPAYMAWRFADFGPFWKTTLQKWHEATRLAAGRGGGGFGAFHRNIIVQVEEVLADRERLLRRTQTRRSDYRVLGQAEGGIPVHTDEEIFDDDDFYHQLLRELIQRRTNSTSYGDQLTMGRQWLAIQRLRSKIKRKVDTKASKGRRVRFQVHSKLAHFMAPVEHSGMSEEARRELYRSLFGQRPT